MSKDQFADLLSGITRKKDDSKLSMAERQQTSTTPSSFNNTNTNTNGGQWANFDLLDRPSLSSSNSAANSNDLFEGFDVLNSSRAAHSTSTFQSQQRPVIQHPQPIVQEHLFEGFSTRTPTPQQSKQSSSTNIDLLDDFDFGTTQSATPLNSMSQHTPVQQQADSQPPPQSLDDLFAIFDAPPKKVNTPTATPNTHPSTPVQPVTAQQRPRPAQTRPEARPQSSHKPANNDAYDEAVASIVDMGFSVEQAVKALKHTHNGLDVQEAINFIMTDAHNKARAKAGLPPQSSSSASSPSTSSTPQPKWANGAEDYIHGFSKLVSGVTKKVMDAQKQFLQAPPVNDGRPAWMREAEKHKRRGEEYEEDPQMISSEELNKLHLQERPEPPRPRKNSVNAPPSRSQRPTHAAPPPPTTQKKQQPQPEPEVDLFTPLPTKNVEPEVDLFSPAPPKTQPFNNNDQMMSSSKRRSARSTPPTRSSTQTPKPARPSVHISSTQMEFFKDSREQGGIAFKNGDFTTALQHYETALSSLPEGHTYQILCMSNLITCYLKVGENKKVVDMSNRALGLIGDGKGTGEEIDGKSMKEFWVKIMSRRAEAQEHLEKHHEALDTWMSVIESGGANKQALDSKRRLLDVLKPKPKTQPKATSKSKSATPPTSARPAAPQPQKSYEAVDRLKKENKAQEKFEEEKYQLLDAVEAKINAWKNGKEDNLRALLASLDTLLWPEAQWKKVGMAELVVPKKVKISYMKAVAKTHPDKVSKDASSEQKMIAQSVFVVLNTAWESFKTQNGIS